MFENHGLVSAFVSVFSQTYLSVCVLSVPLRQILFFLGPEFKLNLFFN